MKPAILSEPAARAQRQLQKLAGNSLLNSHSFDPNRRLGRGTACVVRRSRQWAGFELFLEAIDGLSEPLGLCLFGLQLFVETVDRVSQL
jgi:hypothetical protein